MLLGYVSIKRKVCKGLCHGALMDLICRHMHTDSHTDTLVADKAVLSHDVSGSRAEDIIY